jgi:hypothetical protein
VWGLTPAANLPPQPGVREREDAPPVEVRVLLLAHVAHGHEELLLPLRPLQRLPLLGFGRGVVQAAYSITSSARCRSDGGIVRPRVLAVLRLMTSSNLVGCSMGSSPGFAPLRILSR